MNLVNIILGQTIAGLPESTYRSVIFEENIVRVCQSNNGIVVLSNNKIIKCVANYYSTLEAKSISFNSTASSCHAVKSLLHVPDISFPFNCVQCHRTCWNNYKNDTIRIKPVKRRKTK